MWSGLFVDAECRDGQAARSIDRDAVFAHLNALEDNQVGAVSEPARCERLAFQRVGLPVAEGSDRSVFGDPHLLFDLEPEDADGRHRVEPVVRNPDDEGDAVVFLEPDERPRSVERHFVDMVFADAEQFLSGGGAVAGRQALLNELFGRVVGADGQTLAMNSGSGNSGACAWSAVPVQQAARSVMRNFFMIG